MRNELTTTVDLKISNRDDILVNLMLKEQERNRILLLQQEEQYRRIISDNEERFRLILLKQEVQNRPLETKISELLTLHKELTFADKSSPHYKLTKTAIISLEEDVQKMNAYNQELQSKFDDLIVDCKEL